MTSTPAVIGALRVVLGADTAQLETAFKDSIAKATKFGADLTKTAGVAAAAFSAIGAAIGGAAMKSLAQVDELGKVAQRIGVPVEQLSALKFAADQSGVSLDQLGQGFRDLAQKMSEAAGDNQSGPARAFAAIGVAVTDAAGKLRASDQVLLDVAQKFAGLKDSAAKTTLAIQMFGESGAQMIPFLNQGRDGIAQLGDEARSLGLVIDSETSAAAGRFMKNLDDLKKSKDALVTVMAARLAPQLERLSSQFATYVRDAAKSEETTSFLTTSFKALASVVQVVATGVNILGIVWKRFKDSILVQETTEENAARFWKMWDDIKAASSGGFGEVKAIWDGWAPMVSKAANETAKATAPMIESSRQMGERLAIARAELQALIASPTADFAQKMIAIQQALEKGIIPMSQQITMTNQVLAQMRTEARATLDVLVNAPLETFAAKMAAVRAALQDGTISMREFGKMTKEINDENVDHMHALASSVSSALTSIFGKNKAAAIAAAVINTAQAVTKNLAQYPMPYGGIMAGLALATGAAQIAAIKSTNLGGGGSAPRSVPTAPAPPSENGGGNAGGGLQQTLTVTGMDANQLFGGEAVRRLAERLLDYQRNGGRVVLGGIS
jgi:hypothetical protein